MVYMRTPQGIRVPVIVTRVHDGTFDADGDDVQFMGVPLTAPLENEDGEPVAAQDVYSRIQLEELSALRARVEACGALDSMIAADRRMDERLKSLVSALESTPILSAIVARVRKTWNADDND